MFSTISAAFTGAPVMRVTSVTFTVRAVRSTTPVQQTKKKQNTQKPFSSQCFEFPLYLLF